jgi:endonuclease-3|uniref:Endonuclease III n=1 Tax=Desulfomonile tiedjei TaxID=2358 RepID=A0A7C4ASC1_9BACT
MPEELDENIHEIIALLRQAVREFASPIVTEITQHTLDPFRIFISTLLSLRTKDDVTRAASLRLFEAAKTPQDILAMTQEQLEALIYPVGFYRTKAKRIRDICAELVEKYNGQVPDDLDALLALKGVGRKTANLVVTMAYGKPGVCVDTHVHRISNRLGYVATKTPEETEMALRQKLPKEYWTEYNDLLVTYGQNVCKPVSPFCSKCNIRSLCKRVGVVRSR